MSTQPSGRRSPVLSRTRGALLAGVIGLGVLGAAAADGAFQPTSQAFAAGAVNAPSSGPLFNGTTGFADLVDRVRPAVVSVKVKMVEPSDASDSDGQQQGVPDLPPNHPLYRFFHQFGFGQDGQGGQGGPATPRPRQFGMAQGSGFFISSDGYLVTNNHVVENASDVQVVTDGGTTMPAKVIGTDPKTDLALLKVEGSNLPYVQLSGASPRVGDWVVAVGNPFGLGGTVTAGIVSARGRDIGSGPYDDFIQIDAPVNRGNSGGPTFNTRGEVIGVNTAIFSPSGGSVGIGFDIPADTVQRVVADLKSNGRVTRGWIGVQIQPVTPEIADSLGLKQSGGALVADVTRDGPAAAAGIQSGDAITAVNGQSVAGPRELARAVAAIKPGADAMLTVWRDGSQRSIDVSTGTLPGDKQASAQVPQDQDSQQPTSLAGLGLKLAPASSVAGAGQSGVVVTEVDPSGAAAQALQTGDVIVDVAGKAVRSVGDIRQGIASSKADGKSSVLMRVRNGDNVRYVALPVAKG